MDYRSDLVQIEVFTQFLYPGIILKGDGFDENDRKVIDRDAPLTREQIDALRQSGVKKIRYSREKLRLKKAVSHSMVSDPAVEKALSVLEDVRGAIRVEGQKARISTTEVNLVVDSFMKDIRSNSDAFINLLDIYDMDDYNYTHSVNVATLSILLAISLNLDEEKIKTAGTAGLLHDLGKSLIPDELLDKTSPLTAEDWKIIRNHPVYSYNMIHAQNEFPPEVEKTVLTHHEFYGGGGYPFGISHDKQTVTGQIISIADTFDAASSRRPYKEAKPFNEIFTLLMEESGRKFHPTVTQVFLRDLARKINEEPVYPEGSYVILNTGEIARVVGHRLTPYTLRPIVNIFLRPSGNGKLENFSKRPLQIDMEKDYSRQVVKRILDPKQLDSIRKLTGWE